MKFNKDKPLTLPVVVVPVELFAVTSDSQCTTMYNVHV